MFTKNIVPVVWDDLNFKTNTRAGAEGSRQERWNDAVAQRAPLFAGSTPASPSLTISQSWLRFVSTASMAPSNHRILCYPLLLPSVFASIRVFSSELALGIRWPKYWSFSFSTSPSSEYSGLISFRIDWFDACSPRASQESSPAPQFKGINFSLLGLPYCPALTIMTGL